MYSRSTNERAFRRDILSSLTTAFALTSMALAAPPRVASIDPPGVLGALWVLDGPLDAVTVTFDQPVVVSPADVIAWSVASGSTITPGFDHAGASLTLTFAPPLESDRLTILLDSTIGNGAGEPLDGETNGPLAPGLPSGDGVPGGQAVFRFNVLRGDVTHDGIVDALDVDALVAALGACAGDAGYDLLADLNGDDCVNVLDVFAVFSGLGETLPPVDGAAPVVVDVVPAPALPLADPFDVVELTFSEAIDAALFGARSLHVVDGAGGLHVPSAAMLAPDGLSASFTLPAALPPCDAYDVVVSSGLLDGSGRHLAEPYRFRISGIDQLPPPTIDRHAALTTNPTITIAGSAPGAASVRAVTAAGTVEQPASGGAYALDVPLRVDRINTVYVAAVSGCGVIGAQAATQVTNDTQPPVVTILFPADGATVATGSIDVTGSVGDPLSGHAGVSVTVNGVVAAVNPGIGTNGTFEATGVPLTVGVNVVEVVATDALGNARTVAIAVDRVDPGPGNALLVATAGGGQTGPIESMLPRPLAVHVQRADGTPFSNKLVTFRVTRSDGSLSGGSGPDGRAAYVFTDAQGDASVWWTLGRDAGAGNNRVEATAVGVVGTAYFCAGATPGPATRIVVSANNDQRGQAGADVPLPFKARVLDGANPVPNVPVTLRVTSGDGSIGGRPQVETTSDATGLVSFAFTTGVTPGVNRVEAVITGSPTAPAVFVASGIAGGNGPTTFSGLVLDNALRPIGGVQCVLEIDGRFMAVFNDDVTGMFTITDVPPGPAELIIDATQADVVGGMPVPPGTFSSLHFEDLVVIAGAENGLGRPVLMPILDPVNERTYSTTEPTVLTVAGIDGLRMTVEPGSMFLPDGTPAPAGTTVSLNQVHFDETPMPYPDGAAPPFAWTLQPGGRIFDPPVRVEFPNMTGLPPGAIAYFSSFNHDTGRFDIIGTGTVSDDGSLITTDPGAGITIAGWGGPLGPPDPTTTVGNGSPDCTRTDARRAALGPECSPRDPINDCGVRAELETLILATNPYCLDFGECTPGLARANFSERGGWILQDTTTGAFRVAAVQSGPPCIESCEIDVLPPIFEVMPGEVVVAGFHTHPEGVNASGGPYWVDSPSRVDVDAVRIAPITLADAGFSTDAYIGEYVIRSDVVYFVERRPFPQEPKVRSLRGQRWRRGHCDGRAPFRARETGTGAGSTTAQAVAYGTPVPDVEDALLDERATATVSGRQAVVAEDGVIEVSNVSLSGAPLRLVVRATRDEGLLYGVSSFFEGEEAYTPLPLEVWTLTPDIPVVPLSLVTVTGISALQPGQTLQLDVEGAMNDGTLLDLSMAADGTGYRTSNPDIATVDAGGVVTAHAPGTCIVAISNQGVTSTASIEVTVEVVTVTLAGFAQRKDGTPVSGASLTTAYGGGSSGPDGAFSFDLQVPSEIDDLFIAAEAVAGTLMLEGGASATDLIAGGITDVGTIVMVPVCPVVADTYELRGASVVNTRGVGVGDLDGDGTLDVAVANGNDPAEVFVLLNDGGGALLDGLPYAMAPRATGLAVGDLDGDGYLDLAASNDGGTTEGASILLNQRDGTFVSGGFWSAGQSPSAIAIGDLDGNGALDLALTNRDSDDVSILLNRGRGSFAAAVSYEAGESPRSVAIGDLDGDGDLDLAVAVREGVEPPGASVLLNDGDGTFSLPVTYAVGGVTPLSIAVGDLDGDGALDLAMTDWAAGVVFTLTNDGGGTFGPAVGIDVGSTPYGLCIDDLDGDGDRDLAVTDWSGSVHILFNLGRGSFASPVEYDVSGSPWPLACGDLDGGGIPDLVIGSSNDPVDLTVFFDPAGCGPLDD